MTPILTPDVVEQANHLLAFLKENAKADWRKVVEESIQNDQQVMANIDKMEAALDEMGKEGPVGAYPSSTAVAKEEAGIEGEIGQLAIQALKQAQRIQQCGRGRGKCLIVLSDEPLTAAAETQPETVEPTIQIAKTEEVAAIDETNVNALLRAARDAHRDVKRNLDECVRELRAATKQNEELRDSIVQLEAEKRELESKLEQRTVATWQ